MRTAIITIVALALMATGCPLNEEGTKCSKDTDCWETGLICINGLCVEVGQLQEDVDTLLGQSILNGNSIEQLQVLSHDRYTDAECLDTVVEAGYVTGPHYNDGDVIVIIGEQTDDNPLNHTRYTDAECFGTVVKAGYVTGPHYNDGDVMVVIGEQTYDNPLNHTRYTDTECLGAIAGSGVYAELDTVNTFTTGQVISGELDVENAIRVGNSTSDCTSANVGMIRWAGTKFQGCDSRGWMDFALVPPLVELGNGCANSATKGDDYFKKNELDEQGVIIRDEQGDPILIERDDIVFCSHSTVPSYIEAPFICEPGWHMCTTAEFTGRNSNCCSSPSFFARIEDGNDCRVSHNKDTHDSPQCNLDLVRDENGGTCTGITSGDKFSRQSVNGLDELACSISYNCGVLCCR